MPAPFEKKLRAIYITDPALDLAAQVRLVESALAAGFRAVQARWPGANGRQLYELSKALRPVTRRHGALLLVNDRLDVARAVEADGCHLGHRSLPVPVARRVAGTNNFLIGFSAHNLDELHAATQGGASYCSLSPVFAPISKEQVAEPLGLEAFGKMCRAAHLPVVGLGGIDAASAADCMREGAAGISVIGALSKAEDASRAAAEIMAALG